MSAERVNGISIDLRDNGGGSLLEPQKVASIFLKGGNVTYTSDYEKGETIYADLESDFEFRGPLSVLINRNSASASEIVAGALKDHNRALIIGEATSGKGTVQSLFNLDSKHIADTPLFGSVAITHSKFFRPSGISTQNIGVKPHIDFFEYDDSLWGESTYASALPSETLGHISFSFKANNNEDINYAVLNKIKDDLIVQDSNLQFYKKENKPKKISDKVKQNFTLDADKIKKDITKDDLETLEIVNNERKKESLPLLLDLESIEAEKYLESLDILIGPMMMVFDEYINESERVDERF
jgi:carboxyl-terminal processing protease